MSMLHRRFGDQATLARQLLALRAELETVAVCNTHARYCFATEPHAGRPPCRQHDNSWTPRQPHLSSRTYAVQAEADHLRTTLDALVGRELADAYRERSCADGEPAA